MNHTDSIQYTIEAMQPTDWNQVRAIYQQGIQTGDATFETDLSSWENWDAGHLPACRLVARVGEKIIGWAALSAVSNRDCYAGVAEISIYVSSGHRGSGVGKQLLKKLIDCSERHGFWTLQATILAENLASINLHLGSGFRLVGRRERIGKLNGIWRDTVLLERRSPRVGTSTTDQ